MRLAVIPARGGSQRIPLKNIVEFHGRPIIAWSIEAARSSGCFDEIVVSTDSEEIAAIARQYGASTPFIRPAELSDDHTGTAPVVKHAMQWFIDHGKSVDAVCCIYATAPFIQTAEIQEAFNILKATGCDYVFTATTFSSPIQRALRVEEDLSVKMIQPEYAQTRSQDLVQAWHDAAQFYWGQADAWLQEKPVFQESSHILPVPRARVHDVDTPEDLARLELMFKAVHVSQRPPAELEKVGAGRRLSLGTVQFGMKYGVANEHGQVTPEEASQILSRAKQAGVRALDTATLYGDSEKILGQIGTDGWQISTKLAAVPETATSVYAWMREQLAGSLERLRCDRLHAVLLHRPDQVLGARGPEIVDALRQLKAEGLVAKAGVSAYCPAQLDRLFERAHFDIVQAPCNLLDQRLVRSGWANRLKQMGVELHIRSIFLQGLLLMSEAQRPPTFSKWPSIWYEWNRWLTQTHLDPLQACVLYALSVPGVKRIVVGVDSLAHLQAILHVHCAALPSLPHWPDPLPEDLVDPSRWSAA